MPRHKNEQDEQGVVALEEEATTVPDEDEATIALQQAAALMAKAATDRKNRSELLKDVEGTLGKIRMVDFPDLAESPVVQAFLKTMGMDDLKPGEVRNKGTLAERVREWTVNDMAQFLTKTFTPRETIPVTFNGLTYHLQDDVEVTVPEPIYNIYMDHRKALAEAKKHEDYLLGYSNTPPHPNWLAENSAKVRAFSQMGPNPDARKRGIGFLPAEEGDVKE